MVVPAEIVQAAELCSGDDEFLQQIREWLDDGGDVNDTDGDHWDGDKLSLLSRCAHPHLAKFLLERGADANCVEDEDCLRHIEDPDAFGDDINAILEQRDASMATNEDFIACKKLIADEGRSSRAGAPRFARPRPRREQKSPSAQKTWTPLPRSPTARASARSRTPRRAERPRRRRRTSLLRSSATRSIITNIFRADRLGQAQARAPASVPTRTAAGTANATGGGTPRPASRP